MPLNVDLDAEWLETDGLGGFASGTVSGGRTSKYHALLLAATTPPTGRFVLVNGLDAWIDTEFGSYPISCQHYLPNVTTPDGAKRIHEFTLEPWPRWTYHVGQETILEQEVFVPKGKQAVVLRWRILGGSRFVKLRVRPFLSGRDYHTLHVSNPRFATGAEQQGPLVSWFPYPGLPAVHALANATYHHSPIWYYNFLYKRERERGLDCTEDLLSPGEFTWDFAAGEAILIFHTNLKPETSINSELTPDQAYSALASAEQLRRERFPTRLHRSSDEYIVRRGRGKTIIAGYPWFTDWGRDTFIAMRGLCLATRRLDVAKDILLAWSSTISEGMLPNLFVDTGDTPEFNSVDASLWFVIAVHEFLEEASRADFPVTPQERRRLELAVDAILRGYARGTRHNIAMDIDGLLSAGELGVQLTWMDAKVGDWVVTPRIGKPVEVQALWLNALWIGAQRDKEFREWFEQANESFQKRFWYDDGQYLYDVVDLDHVRGNVDSTIRPNQILAVGGLPLQVLAEGQARKVIDFVEEKLYTPIGLRSLVSDDPSYRGRYHGGVFARDGAYHQGTVWAWLIGPFVEAWVRVRGGSPAVIEEARQRFLPPLLKHLTVAGLGHVSEIADGDPPHTPKGCPFQAWSVGELLRLQEKVIVPMT
ncbi:MAG: amylo-alpha-1,6-glucosidase [Gemmataceae bacterium]